ACGDLDKCFTVEGCQNIRDCQADADRYVAHGIDVKLAVATGFPGFALSASAFDRLRGRGSAEALSAQAAHALFLPDQTIDSPGLSVGLGTLGVPSTGIHDAAGRA